MRRWPCSPPAAVRGVQWPGIWPPASIYIDHFFTTNCFVAESRSTDPASLANEEPGCHTGQHEIFRQNVRWAGQMNDHIAFCAAANEFFEQLRIDIDRLRESVKGTVKVKKVAKPLGRMEVAYAEIDRFNRTQIWRLKPEHGP